MGFTKVYLPDLQELIKLHEKLGTDAFISRYKKCESIIGPIESVEYFKKIINLKK